MSILLKVWPRLVTYFFLGTILNEHVVTESTTSTIKCGSVFITVSSVDYSYIELNWETNCASKDLKPFYIALYNKDIRNDKEAILYEEINANEYPQGYYKTKVSFNLSSWPDSWKYNCIAQGTNGPQDLDYWIVSFTSSHDILDIRSLRLEPTWMGDNRNKLSSIDVGKLLIPGTHDSGCYGGVRLWEDYILTQNLPIWHQLVFGIRYLDLRIGYHHDGRFSIHHDLVKVKDLEIVYGQIKKFVERSPKEIIIVDFHRFPYPSVWPDKLHLDFINYTLQRLGNIAYKNPDPHSTKAPKMQDIWNAGKNLILTYAEKKYTKDFPELWESVTQNWANTKKLTSLKDFLVASLENNHKTMLNALMGELTPTLFDILMGENKLKDLANKVNSNLTKWVRDEWNKKVNIVTSDFFLGNDLINVAINVNRNR